MGLTINCGQITDILSKENLLVFHNTGGAETAFDFISHDSRNITKNTLFFCKGAGFKEEYLFDAVKKGAVCYMSEKKYNTELPCFLVTDIRHAIALIAPIYYNYPYKNLILTGITGTKGKTTAAYFIKNILDEFTQTKTGLSSSIENYTGKRSEEAHLNTPEPCDLQQLFYEAAECKLKYFTMEATSQAYKTGRLKNIKFDNGIFLNIAEDHIGPLEHEDFEDYLVCKLEFMKNCSNIVINAETDCFERVLAAAESSETLEQIVLYGGEQIKERCDFYYAEPKKEDGALSFYLKNDKTGYSEKFAIKIQGIFNIENAAAAAVLCIMLGVDSGSIKRGLLKTEVPGRMTVIESGGFTVIVDYAHNYLSFNALYSALKTDYPDKKIISVGGAPGGKAYKRRRDFAEIAGKHSDYIYITSEDPQFEDPAEICEEIASYLPAGTAFEIILDRAAAVEKAVRSAAAGDVVVLLAKGDEEYQKVNGSWEFYESDLKIARRILQD
ncbi:MAG: UDP-N-acetylmuramyl-tripeptide synthetase [Oscillospiraceae bacterium]|nr:UDP-N-acetylmuramyl-tripeptide synthetase [Oscillospiraceae bacterium]